jgi:hypothetical protein
MLNTLQRVTLHTLRNGMVITAISTAAVALAQTPAGGAAPVPSVPPATAQVPPTAPPANTGTVKIGKDIKATLGKVTDVEKADNGCLIEFKNDKGDAQIELGLAKFCALKPSLKGRQVELEYRLETVLANECMGNPKCKKTESLPVIVEVKVLN